LFPHCLQSFGSRVLSWHPLHDRYCGVSHFPFPISMYPLRHVRFPFYHSILSKGGLSPFLYIFFFWGGLSFFFLGHAASVSFLPFRPVLLPPPPPPPRGLLDSPLPPTFVKPVVGAQGPQFQLGGTSSYPAEIPAALISEACFILVVSPPSLPAHHMVAFVSMHICGWRGGGGGEQYRQRKEPRFGSPARAQLFFRPRRSEVT
jgi:hypothetical protein